jgi:hypothetical protein
VALRLTPRATADRIVATAIAAGDGLAIVGGAASRPKTVHTSGGPRLLLDRPSAVVATPPAP